ncbi:hypothetical protein AEGHOMDF_4644 [Methylobacterium soli]|nr:hypothetical protein AEGHOMDF_4644 [Methylobacterium soli]
MPLVPLALLVAFAGGHLGVRTARADEAATIGYRIELQACRGEVCLPISVPTPLWEGRYACDGRATWVAEDAAELGPAVFGLPAGPWNFRARCAPVTGDRRA